MRTAPTTGRRPRRTMGEIARGFAALLLLAGLLGGIPIALFTVTGGWPPLPDAVPTLDDILEAFTQRDDGSLLVATLTWAGWVAWASFAISVLVEIPATVRGVHAPRLPALGVQQRLAAGLVTAVAAVFTTTTVATAGVPPATPVVAESTALSENANENSTQQDTSLADDEATLRSVQPGDTLWGLAADHLDDGHRWPEIAALNRDRPQPDGRSLNDPDLIHPGWTLQLPAGAHGDRLTIITSAEADQAPAAQDAAHGSDGDSTNSDAAADGQADAGAADQGDQRGADAGAVETGANSQPDAQDQPGSEAQPAPPQADTQPEPAEQALTEQDGGDPDQDEQGSGGIPVRTVGGIGALMAAGILVYLAAVRARQQRQRRPGQRLAAPDDDAEQLETELRQVADPVSVTLVDRAMRTLTANAAQTGTTLPAVRFARLTADQFELYLTEPGHVGHPFIANDEQTMWVLTTDHDGELLDTDEAANYPAPYPSLVTVGYDTDGGHVMVDLEQLRVLTIESPTDTDAADVIAGMAVDLGTSQWGDDLRVTLVGTSPELADAVGNGRIRHVDNVDDLLDQVAARAGQDRAAMASGGADTLAAARAGGFAEAAWAGEILLIATPLTTAQHERLTLLLNEEPRVAVAAVTTDPQPLAEWALRLDPADHDLATLEPGGYSITPQRLSYADTPRLSDLLQAAERFDPAPTSWRVDDRPEPRLGDIPRTPGQEASEPHSDPSEVYGGAAPADTSAPAGTNGHKPAAAAAEATVDDPGHGPGAAVTPLHRPPVVGVLGPVEIQNVGEPTEPSKRGQLTALAAYLALNPGQPREAVDDAMWRGSVSVATRNTTMTKLRHWLGTSPDGGDYLPRVTTDGYHLHPDVRTDWHTFTDLLPDGPAEATNDDLQAALDLVRGQPFTGVNPQKYIWAEHIKQDMISAIVDVADEAARRALLAGDHHTALHSVTAGLNAEPGSEMLWRHRLRAHHAANDRNAIRYATQQLTQLADELGSDLDTETIELIAQLTNPRALAI